MKDLLNLNVESLHKIQWYSSETKIPGIIYLFLFWVIHLGLEIRTYTPPETVWNGFPSKQAHVIDNLIGLTFLLLYRFNAKKNMTTSKELAHKAKPGGPRICLEDPLRPLFIATSRFTKLINYIPIQFKKNKKKVRRTSAQKKLKKKTN